VSTVALTPLGALEGRREQGITVFRGVPYARSPRDGLRFRHPEPLEPWQSTRRAFSFGSAAPQVGPVHRLIRTAIGAVGSSQSQDCLYLNIWTPGIDRLRRPVMVFIHGGAFILGSGAARLWQGWHLARRGDVVVVTINYRLGALGFLRWRTLVGERGRPPANAGILDQIAALRWVRDHIDAFGGDPENVTIFGESAGAMSVGTLLGARRAKGLFHKAILQSGAAHNVSTSAEADEVSQLFVRELGLENPSVEKLAKLPVTEIMRAQALVSAETGIRNGALAWQPCVDGDLLERHPLQSVEQGLLSADVPMLVGTNRDEWKLFIGLDPAAMRLDEAQLRSRFLRTLRGSDDEGRPLSEQAWEAYYRVKGRRGGEPSERWGAFQSDRIFHYPAVRLADVQSEHQPRTYAYVFEWAPPTVQERLGACHGLELPFVFGTLRAPWLRTWLGLSPRAQRLCRVMQDSWVHFARYGSPGHERLPDWPSYSRQARSTMAFDGECTLREDPHERGREFWHPIMRSGVPSIGPHMRLVDSAEKRRAGSEESS
jgi:para-nitrobenzyl esterase